MAVIYIYVLKCPFTGAVRYVGKGTSLKARLRQHISEARIGKVKSHKCDWIRSTLRRGARPIMEIDEIVPDSESWKEAEQRRIAHYWAAGCDLTNGTDGGDTSVPLTEDGRRELSARASARFGTPEGPLKQAAVMRQLCADPDFVAARAAAAKESRSTPEYKAALSARSEAQWQDPVYRERMKKRAELNADPAFRAKLSAPVTKAQSDPEFRKMKAEMAREAWERPDVRERQIAALRVARGLDGRDGVMKDAKPTGPVRVGVPGKGA